MTDFKVIDEHDDTACDENGMCRDCISYGAEEGA